jgi:hypothetical protein
MKINNAIMITVSCRDWDWPKTILVSMRDSYDGKRIKDLAEEAFERYKKTTSEQDLTLLSYCYYGDIEVLSD